VTVQAQVVGLVVLLLVVDGLVLFAGAGVAPTGVTAELERPLPQQLEGLDHVGPEHVHVGLEVLVSLLAGTFIRLLEGAMDVFPFTVGLAFDHGVEVGLPLGVLGPGLGDQRATTRARGVPLPASAAPLIPEVAVALTIPTAVLAVVVLLAAAGVAATDVAEELEGPLSLVEQLLGVDGVRHIDPFEVDVDLVPLAPTSLPLVVADFPRFPDRVGEVVGVEDVSLHNLALVLLPGLARRGLVRLHRAGAHVHILISLPCTHILISGHVGGVTPLLVHHHAVLVDAPLSGHAVVLPPLGVATTHTQGSRGTDTGSLALPHLLLCLHDQLGIVEEHPAVDGVRVVLGGEVPYSGVPDVARVDLIQHEVEGGHVVHHVLLTCRAAYQDVVVGGLRGEGGHRHLDPLLMHGDRGAEGAACVDSTGVVGVVVVAVAHHATMGTHGV